jgi:Family of unknown function (DUF6311)
MDHSMQPQKNKAGPKATLRQALLINGALGIAFACYLFAPAFLAGSVSAFLWPQGDTIMFLTAVKYFIHDTWHFPLFVTSFLERSYPQSLVYADCMPLGALIAKIIYKTTGYEFFYLSWWFVLSIVAQPIAFSLLLWAGGVRKLLLLILGGAFSLLVPAFLFRFGHPWLFGHFLITLSMALYFASTGDREKQEWPKWVLTAWPALLLSCTAINIYILAMTFTFFAAAIGHSALIDYRSGRIQAIRFRAFYAAGMLAAIIALMYVLGFFVPYTGGLEFGVHSFNLLSPFVPQLTTLFSNSMTILDATGGQYEGYNYFGAGFLGLILVAIAFGDNRARQLLIRHPVLLCALAALTLFALSNVAYAGKLLLWKVPAPHFFGNFRSSGRFIWPVTYFCLFLCFYALETARPLWRPLVLVVACLFLQWEDAGNLTNGLWNFGHSTSKPALNNDPVGLRKLIARHTGVYTTPDFACAKSRTITLAIMDIAYYAALENRSVNTVDLARNPTDMNCKIDKTIMDAKLDKNELVVAFYEDGKITNLADSAGCAKLDKDVVCLASKQVPITDEMVRKLYAPQ